MEGVLILIGGEAEGRRVVMVAGGGGEDLRQPRSGRDGSGGIHSPCKSTGGNDISGESTRTEEEQEEAKYLLLCLFV